MTTDQEAFWDMDDKDTWQTPDDLVETLTEHVDIALDPCAGLFTYIGDQNYTVEETDDPYDEYFHNGRVLKTGVDSLSRDWDTGGIAYINPPFSYKGDFIQKALDELDAGRIDGAIILTPDSTDVQSWWHGQLRENAPVVWFSEGRISFIDPDTGETADSPTFGTALNFVGPIDVWPESLFDALDKRGEVDVRWSALDDVVDAYK